MTFARVEAAAVACGEDEALAAAAVKAWTAAREGSEAAREVARASEMVAAAVVVDEEKEAAAAAAVEGVEEGQG